METLIPVPKRGPKVERFSMENLGQRGYVAITKMNDLHYVLFSTVNPGRPAVVLFESFENYSRGGADGIGMRAAMRNWVEQVKAPVRLAHITVADAAGWRLFDELPCAVVVPGYIFGPTAVPQEVWDGARSVD